MPTHKPRVVPPQTKPPVRVRVCLRARTHRRSVHARTHTHSCLVCMRVPACTYTTHRCFVCTRVPACLRILHQRSARVCVHVHDRHGHACICVSACTQACTHTHTPPHTRAFCVYVCVCMHIHTQVFCVNGWPRQRSYVRAYVSVRACVSVSIFQRLHIAIPTTDSTRLT